MIKYIYCVRKPETQSGEEFRRYWLGEHASLFAENAEAMKVRKYVQCHTLDHPVNRQLRASRGTLEPFDGVGEVWWDSIEDMMAAASSPEGAKAMQILREDDVHFIDPARSSVFIAEVHKIIG